jgi:hypothetical protein
MEMPSSLRPICRSLVVLLIAGLVPLIGASRADAGPAEQEVALYQLANQARGQAGLGGLTRDPAADSVARGWSTQMAQANTLSHNPGLASTISAYVTNQWTRLGENVGVGYDAQGLHNAFMNSSGHRANILGDYNRVGIGAVYGGDGRLWVTVVFIKGPAVAPVVAASAFTPFSDASTFVRQQYLDILGRPADDAGLWNWSVLLSTGVVSTGDVGATFLASSEFGGVVAPITRLYFAAFHRVPDPTGIHYWLSLVRGGMSFVDLARTFAQSTEFQTRMAGATNRDFVRMIYINVLGREPDADGLAYWGGLLDLGRLDRGQVLWQFSESGEFVYSTRFGVTTAMAYAALLGRPADTDGMVYWVDQFWHGTPTSVLIGTFYKTAEYDARF